MAEKQTKQKCFVVGPIGDEDSEDRTHADWLLEAVILPVFREHYSDFVVERADKISRPGSINEQVITALLDSELVIADITTLNANAFYEIGIRHTVQKPIIHMHLKGQRIPFDIAPFRSIEFSRHRPRDIETAKLNLKAFLDTVLAADYEVDNPVTFSRGKVEFQQTATAPEKLLLEELEAIQGRLSHLEATAPSRLPPKLHGEYIQLVNGEGLPPKVGVRLPVTLEIRAAEGTVEAKKKFASFVTRWVVGLLGKDPHYLEPGVVSYRVQGDVDGIVKRLQSFSAKESLPLQISIIND